MNNKNTNIDIGQLMQAAMSQRQVQQPQNNNGIGYCDALSLILITLKCLGLISCSWVVPFLPLAIPFILYAFIVLLRIY